MVVARGDDTIWQRQLVRGCGVKPTLWSRGGEEFCGPGRSVFGGGGGGREKRGGPAEASRNDDVG